MLSVAMALARVESKAVMRTAAVSCLAAASAFTQTLPPPQDGDTRVMYLEALDQTEVWLTLEPRSPAGEKLPIFLELRATYPGRRPVAPPAHLELRALVDRLWAPTPELRVAADDKALAFEPPGPSPVYAGSTMTAVAGTLSLATLERMARARTLGGNALRLDFALDAAQRAAIGRFTKRVLSADPARSE
jgi:hypothetical protein